MSDRVASARQAAARLQAGDTAGALEGIDAALALAPDDPALLTLRGDALFRARRYPEARRAWSALAHAPGSGRNRARLLLKMSRAAEASGDLPAAMQDGLEALAIEPADAATQDRLLALGLRRHHGDAAAQAAFAAAHVGRHGASPLGDRLRALHLTLDADADAAAAVLTADPQAYAADPAFGLRVVDALLARGWSAGVMGIVDVLDEARPGDVRVAERRVRVLRAAAAPARELSAAWRRLADHPGADDRHRLQYARACLGDAPAESLRVCRAMLARVPDDEEAAALAIRAACRLDRGDTVSALLAQGMAGGRGDVPSRLRAARLFAAAGRNEQVLATLAEDDGASALALRVDAAWQVGDYARALALADRLGPDVDDGLAGQVRQMRDGVAAVPREHARFPDALFEQVLGMRVPARAPARDLVALVTSNLAAGGAERQVALTAAGVARLRAGLPGARTVLIARSLDPARGRAAMLPLAQDPALEIDDLSRIAPGAALDELARLDEPAEHLRLVAAFPARMARDIAGLYLRFVQLRPRLVHLWQDGLVALGSVAAVLAGVPRIVASVRNVLPEADDRRRHRRHLPGLYAALGRRTDVAFSTNAREAARQYARLAGMPATRFALVRNGVEVARLHAGAGPAEVARVRAELGAGQGALVGGVFRLAPAKRPGTWIRTAAAIAAELPDARFLVVGDGALREEVRELAERLGLAGRLTLAGRRQPVEPWMGAMDVLLLASAVEGLPNVLLEAQALGVPVVTTDAGDAAAAVDPAGGLVVPDATPERLAAAVLRLLRAPARIAAARLSGPRFVERGFGMEAMIAATMRLYDGPADDAGRS